MSLCLLTLPVVCRLAPLFLPDAHLTTTENPVFEMESAIKHAPRKPARAYTTPLSLPRKFGQVFGVRGRTAANATTEACHSKAAQIVRQFQPSRFRAQNLHTTASRDLFDSSDYSDSRSINTAMATVHSDDFVTAEQVQPHVTATLGPEKTKAPPKQSNTSVRAQLVDDCFESDSGVPTVSSVTGNQSSTSEAEAWRGWRGTRCAESTVLQADIQANHRLQRRVARDRELRRSEWDKRYEFAKLSTCVLDGRSLTR